MGGANGEALLTNLRLDLCVCARHPVTKSLQQHVTSATT